MTVLNLQLFMNSIFLFSVNIHSRMISVIRILSCHVLISISLFGFEYFHS